MVIESYIIKYQYPNSVNNWKTSVLQYVLQVKIYSTLCKQYSSVLCPLLKKQIIYFMQAQTCPPVKLFSKVTLNTAIYAMGFVSIADTFASKYRLNAIFNLQNTTDEYFEMMIACKQQLIGGIILQSLKLFSRGYFF